MTQTEKAVMRYQERAQIYAEQARVFSEFDPVIAKYFQRESAIDYQIARRLMGVKEDA